MAEDQKQLAAEYIKTLKNKLSTKDEVAKKDRLAKRLHALVEMDKVAIEITKHWKEDIDAAELVSSMRR